MSKKRLLAGILAATMTMSCLTGCSTVTKSDLKGEMKDIAAASYGNEKIYLDEVNYYLRNTQVSYEYYYTMYGMSDVWSTESAVDSLFEDTLATINQTKILNEYAKNNDITLTEDEEKKVAEKVDELVESTEHYTVAAGQDKDMLTKILTENALANKAYYTITEATEIKATEEGCIKNEVKYLLFNEKQEKETAEETGEATESAEVTETTAEEASFTEADANAALELLKKGDDIDEVGKKYGLTSSTGNYNKDEETSDELGKACVSMKKGDAQVVYADGVGWYAVVCTLDKAEDASKDYYNEKVEEEKTNHFNEVYEGLDKQKFEVNDKVVKSLDVANTPMLVTETEEEKDTAAETEAATESESATEATTEATSEAESE